MPGLVGSVKRTLAFGAYAKRVVALTILARSRADMLPTLFALMLVAWGTRRKTVAATRLVTHRPESRRHGWIDDLNAVTVRDR
jgi:hypothetical protein